MVIIHFAGDLHECAGLALKRERERADVKMEIAPDFKLLAYKLNGKNRLSGTDRLRVLSDAN